MGFTPGRIGEFVKVYLIQSKYKIEKSKTSGIVAAERIIEFLSLVFISFLGIFLLEINIVVTLLIFILFVLILFAFSKKSFQKNIVDYLSKINFIEKRSEKIKQFFSSTNNLLSGKNFLMGFLFSLIAWFLESFAFYIILSKFNFAENFIWINFTYLISVLFGSISMLPGGIGTTEGSLTYLLVQHGIDKNIAIFCTYIIRIATLWFSTLLGIIALVIFLTKNNLRIKEIFIRDEL